MPDRSQSTLNNQKTLAEPDAIYFTSLILYEDSHLLLIYKPHGLLVQGDLSRDKSLLNYGKTYLIDRYDKPGRAYLSLPHRLDRPVAGLCVMAKTTKAMQRLSLAFQQNNCKKFYLAIVEGTFKKKLETQNNSPTEWQEQVHYLRKEVQNNKSYIAEASVPNAKRAQLQYRLLATDGHHSIVIVQLETGRHHQIRCQLAALGHPIRNDLKYGAKYERSRNNGSISLYAFALQVPMPVLNVPLCNARPFAWKLHYEGTCQVVLQSICLPWEWQGHDEGIWQLCTENPQILKELTSIF